MTFYESVTFDTQIAILPNITVNSEKHAVQKKFIDSGIKRIHHLRGTLCPATLPHLGHFFSLIFFCFIAA